MEERDAHRRLTTISEARRKAGPTRSLRVSRQAKTVTLKLEQQLALTQSRIAAIVSSGRVRQQWVKDPVTGKDLGYVYVGEVDAATLVNRLLAQRSLLWRQLGPRRVSGWFPHNFSHNGRLYNLDPYVAWAREFFAASTTNLRVGGRSLSIRDTAIWLMWHFRGKVIVRVCRLDSKIRGHLRECVQCNHRYKLQMSFDPADPKPGRCPKCGYLGARHIEPKAVVSKRIERITKVWLRWRFKLSRRDLDGILSAVAMPRAQQDSTA